MLEEETIGKQQQQQQETPAILIARALRTG